jgi:hypothetical protein
MVYFISVRHDRVIQGYNRNVSTIKLKQISPYALISVSISKFMDHNSDQSISNETETDWLTSLLFSIHDTAKITSK